MLVVAGFAIGGKVHPLGFILAAIPILLWAGLHVAHWTQRFGLAGRRRRIVQGALDELRRSGFDVQLLFKGDLGDGDTWVAFDFTRREAALLTDTGNAAHPLSGLTAIRVAEGARRFGASTPEYYCLGLDFAAADAPHRKDAGYSVVAPNLRAARRWARELHERLGARVPVTDYAG